MFVGCCAGEKLVSILDSVGINPPSQNCNGEVSLLLEVISLWGIKLI
jgi:hypothetical protein